MSEICVIKQRTAGKQLSESEEILELAAKVGWGLSEEMREIYSMYFNGM